MIEEEKTKYIIKKSEGKYYKIPIEREDEFDELADIDSGYNINDWCGSDFVLQNFDKCLIKEDDLRLFNIRSIV